jgi:glycosyltransferase involved in cell wall biosynthesis
MRILLIHSFYQHFGGEDSVVNSEIELLKQHGEKMYLFTRRNEETKDFGITQRALFFPQTIYSWNSGAEIEGVVERFKPDIAFVHNVYPLISPAAYHTLHKLRVPTVQMLHGFRPYCPNGFFYTQGKICEACKFGNYLNAVVRRCYKDSYGLSALYALSLGLNRLAGMVDKISAFICLTPFFKAKMLEVGIPESKLFIRPNFICPPPPLPHVPGGNKYVLFAGRLVPEKGCWTLLRAFEQLVDVPLKIMGTGPIEQELRNYVAKKRLFNVELLGFKSGSEKWDLLRSSACVVIPSEWYESFSVTALEAYVVGKPIIASRLGGLPYVVEESKSGLLFEAGHVDQLAQKVRFLWEHPDEAERMGEYGHQLSKTKYSPEQGYRNLINIFSQIHSDAGRGIG